MRLRHAHHRAGRYTTLLDATLDPFRFLVYAEQARGEIGPVG
jgi:hypothetical protein